MKLNVGCGGNKFPFYDLECEVNCDVQRPKSKVPSFIICDIRSLPFADRAFERAYAFNVLEHIRDYRRAIDELDRVSDEVLIRLDKIHNLANWFTSDHEDLALKNALIPFPRPIKWIAKVVRFPIDHSLTLQTTIHAAFPAFIKLGLLYGWNYYRIK